MPARPRCSPGTNARHASYGCMTTPRLPTDHITKLNISHALGQRSTKVAVLIVEAIRNALELIDQQPSAVVEALVEHAKEIKHTKTDITPKRRELLNAMQKYCEVTLQEVQARERRWLQGITGEAP